MARVSVRCGLLGLAGTLCAGGAASQTSVVIPPGHDTAEGNGVAHWALAPFTANRQLIVDESYLAPVRGRPITSLAVRRNHGGTVGSSAGRLRLIVRLSHAARSPQAASERFSDNRGNRASVAFQGEVSLPVADPANTPAWSSRYALTLSFQRPFIYAGGPLCIETMTVPVQRGNANKPSWWPIDAAISQAEGIARPFGTSCLAGVGPQPAGALARSLLPGASAQFYTRTRLAAAPPVFTLGKSDRDYSGLPLPFDLTPIGAPGCSVLNNSLVALSPARDSSGLSSANMWVPTNPAVAGVTVFGQWFQLDPTANALHLTSSNSVAATFASTQSAWKVAWIESEDSRAASGTVLRGRVPVVRIEAR